MLEELGWGIYFYGSQKAVETKLMNGWCAWEYAQQHGGSSPFPAETDVFHIHGNGSQDLLSSRMCCDRVQDDLPGAEERGAWELLPSQTPARVYVAGCSPREYGFVFYDSDAGRCTQDPMQVAAGPGRQVAIY